VRDGTLGTFLGPRHAGYQVLPGAASPRLGRLQELAVAPDAGLVAGLSDDHRVLLTALLRSGRADIAPVPRLGGTQLAGPSIDVSGTTWVCDTGAVDPVLWQVPRVGPPRALPVRLPPGERLTAAVVARDGARVVLVARPSAPAGEDRLYVAALTDTGPARPLVAGVGRDPHPVRIGPLRRLAPEAHRVVDVAWVSADQFVVLERVADGSLQLLTVALDGLEVRTLPSPPPTAVSVTAAPGVAPVFVVTRPPGDDVGGGMAYHLVGRSWVPVGPAAQVAYPG
jgi:hypothetical protein